MPVADPGLTKILLRIDDVPPSLNNVGSRGGWHRFYKEKRFWQQTVERYLLVHRGYRPMASPVSVMASLRFPQRRTRDEGNFRFLLEKAVGDALVNGNWLPDDSSDHYRFRELIFEPITGTKRTDIVLTFPGG